MIRRLLLSLATAALVAAVSASAAAGAPKKEKGSFSLLQMNLCLSGFAGCYPDTAYPAVVDEAITKIRDTRPSAVTLNEACSGDVERIARETGYASAFTTVIYRGAPLECKTPTGRGVFGNAVLTRAPIVSSESAPYVAQAGVEERRYLCVVTADGVRACTSHLSTAGTAEAAAANDAQCRELTAVLDAGELPTIFGGDVNRRESCAPKRAWTERDEEATQAAGIQHVYGTFPGLVRPRDTVLPMTYSDHDALLVTAKLRG